MKELRGKERWELKGTRGKRMAEYAYGGRNTVTFQRLHGYKNLIVWQKGSDLSSLINQAVSEFGPGYYKLGILPISWTA